MYTYCITYATNHQYESMTVGFKLSIYAYFVCILM